ncbi:Glycosylphosphatidylinositol anchor biosynthesis protein 11 [Colletotrichum trifolii]|uniref:Glycosylphosphatidylinositol anchor biosynthesis protein 11 n=1 Tax=Colletotrichum trifolii TaxID=5466 RepID=A0A4R8RIE8_COLTR|nr:Glycosylphosphatidylinositol anchor biosynthesis protein 11 [Colletotrichum trifolii]
MPLVDPVTMSTSSKAASDAGKPKDGLHPVQPLPTPVAQAVRHLQPAILFALFVAQFNALVSDPVRTLQKSLPVVAVIQILYAFVALPAAGSQTSKTVRKPRPGEKKKAESTGPNPFIAIFLSVLLATLVTPAIHLLLVLFGAPFLTHVPHTLLCSANVSLLTLFPLFYVHGVDASTWRSIASASAPLDEAYGGLVGGLLGSWLGAVPIPLDWDREWQKWPVTILCGLYGGYVLGKLVGGLLAFGKRLPGSARDDE